MAKLTEQDILNVLSHEQWKPMLEVKKDLETQGKRLALGSLYYIVDSLERQGWVEIRRMPDITGGRGGRPRREVRLTSGGLRERIRNSQEGDDSVLDSGFVPA